MRRRIIVNSAVSWSMKESSSKLMMDNLSALTTQTSDRVSRQNLSGRSSCRWLNSRNLVTSLSLNSKYSTMVRLIWMICNDICNSTDSEVGTSTWMCRMSDAQCMLWLSLTSGFVINHRCYLICLHYHVYLLYCCRFLLRFVYNLTVFKSKLFKIFKFRLIFNDFV